MSFAIKPIRGAGPADHPAFVRLFPELAVDDPVKDRVQFEKELMADVLIAEADDGEVVGYTYFQILQNMAYVRHIVSAPEVRRAGVGRALMNAIAARARTAGCTTWCLNVKPENTAAIALYERFGLARAHASRALQITWAQVHEENQLHDAHVSARAIKPADDARVEAAMRLVPGQLASARTLDSRILLALHEPAPGEERAVAGAIVGATVFHPAFPGAYPFRAARPELAFTLLEAIFPYARPEDDIVNVVVEAQPEIADALIAAGARVKLDIVHMKGPLPSA